MLNRREWRILSIKTFFHFKCNIRMDLDFHVRIHTCKKRVSAKQPQDCRLQQTANVMTKSLICKTIRIMNREMFKPCNLLRES